MKFYIGIDNGVSGSICIMDANGKVEHYAPTPVFKSVNYTKAVGYSQRVDSAILTPLLHEYAHHDVTVLIERPMINPMRWKASVSAIRCDEATRAILELLKLKFIYVDSREWQTPLLPKRPAVPKLPKDASPEDKKKNKAAKVRFKAETKELSLAVGQRLFPAITFKKDADAALIAEWGRREKL